MSNVYAIRYARHDGLCSEDVCSPIRVLSLQRFAVPLDADPEIDISIR